MKIFKKEIQENFLKKRIQMKLIIQKNFQQKK